jgi:hypothetical protein
MPFFRSTAYESEVFRNAVASGESPIGAVHRIEIVTVENGVKVTQTTNDDDDDGVPDGDWATWQHFTTRESALERAGRCRVGVSGVVVTVTLDGEEVR